MQTDSSVDQHGMIHEKDRGLRTTKITSAMKSYDHPDSTSTRVRPDQFLSFNSALPDSMTGSILA